MGKEAGAATQEHAQPHPARTRNLSGTQAPQAFWGLYGVILSPLGFYYVTINTTFRCCRFLRLTKELSLSASSHPEQEGLCWVGLDGKGVSPGE